MKKLFAFSLVLMMGFLQFSSGFAPTPVMAQESLESLIERFRDSQGTSTATPPPASLPNQSTTTTKSPLPTNTVTSGPSVTAVGPIFCKTDETSGIKRCSVRVREVKFSGYDAVGNFFDTFAANKTHLLLTGSEKNIANLIVNLGGTTPSNLKADNTSFDVTVTGVPKRMAKGPVVISVRSIGDSKGVQNLGKKDKEAVAKNVAVDNKLGTQTVCGKIEPNAEGKLYLRARDNWGATQFPQIFSVALYKPLAAVVHQQFVHNKDLGDRKNWVFREVCLTGSYTKGGGFSAKSFEEKGELPYFKAPGTTKATPSSKSTTSPSTSTTTAPKAVVVPATAPAQTPASTPAPAPSTPVSTLSEEDAKYFDSSYTASLQTLNPACLNYEQSTDPKTVIVYTLPNGKRGVIAAPMLQNVFPGKFMTKAEGQDIDLHFEYNEATNCGSTHASVSGTVFKVLVDPSRS